MKIRAYGVAAMGFLILAAASSGVNAKGRRPEYEDSPAYAPRRVQRGSAANPNPAFAPPRFDDQPSGTPRDIPTAPSTNQASRQNSGSRSASGNTSSLQKDGTAAPGTVPLSDTPLPPPRAVPGSPDASEPPLPDYPTDDNTGKAAADLLSKPSGQSTHPPAK
jgi:hypothetical protein